MQGRLALFDFDGTITRKDSFIRFIRFYKGSVLTLFGFILLSPVILLYKCGLIKSWRAKEIVMTWFFRNERYDIFKFKCREFGLKIIPGLVNASALNSINDHIRNGDRVIVISATLEEYLAVWCDQLKLELLATRIEVEKGLITGKIRGKNCRGAEKKARLNEYLDIRPYKDIFVYCDSRSDKPLMDLANHKFYKYF